MSNNTNKSEEYNPDLISLTDDSGKEYLCLVNAEMYQNNSIEIVYDSSKCSITELLLNGTLERPNFGQDDQAFTLYPGQMKMFRIDRK